MNDLIEREFEENNTACGRNIDPIYIIKVTLKNGSRLLRQQVRHTFMSVPLLVCLPQMLRSCTV